ncbi:class I adenylate-forming enzyme family protein [Nocardia mangyaensis]|uniref:class I adenylate-forming enzyme family protein n=1 Tax=Nocardia mangyaensis TaxID=2213200 RepID=UPI002674E7C1|nr:class I adenylate-forming enzyme family protein [Nocardia mangyaensis]MDO3647915.1 class I adenylate-forming enzyme family protein [Nocardia mangyaensis]
MRLYEALAAALRAHPDGRLTTTRAARAYRDVLVDSTAKAVLLDRIAPRGARVLLAMPNHLGYVSSLLAVLSRGDVPVLADPSLTTAEIDTLITDCGIDAVIAADDTGGIQIDDRSWARATGAEGPRPALAHDTELCRLTSGSTRSPACIEFRAEAVLAAATTWAEASELTPDDRSLCFAGLYNGLAFNTTLIPNLLTGAQVILATGLPSAGSILRQITSTEPTILVAFPEAYNRVTEYPVEAISTATRAALAAIRLRLSSAAPLSARTAARMVALSGPVSDYYGIAETGPITFHRTPTAGGNNGRLLPGVSVASRPRTDGTPVLHVRTRSMGTKYLNYPGEFERSVASDGSYVTSDTGTVIEGQVTLSGRAHPTLEIGGRKFSVDSVRDPILSFDGVADCHVVQITTPSGRPCVAAAVETVGVVDMTRLRAHLRAAIAAYKVPEVLLGVDALPRGATGKVKSAAVRELLLRTFRQPRGGGQ